MKRQRKTTKRDGIIHSYRKAINLSGSIVVSLPKEYVKEHNIQPGDTIIMSANSLLTLVKKEPI